MNIQEIYDELQVIDEFHSTFNPTSESKSRMIILKSCLDHNWFREQYDI
jgi:hypothetical protein